MTESAQEPVPGLSPPPSAESPSWGIWDVVRIVVLALVTTALFSMVALGVAAHGDTRRAVLERLARNPRVVLPAQMLAYLVVVGYMVAIVRTTGRRFWSEVRWNFPVRAAGGFLVLGAAVALLIQMASALLPIPRSLPIDQYFTDTGGAYLMAIFGITFAPLVEELFFRGFLFPVVARSLGVVASVAITALCFALIHASQLAQAWAPLLLLWIVGVVLTTVRAWTKSVGASFCVHVGYNFALFLMLFFASDHFRHLEKLR